MLDDTPMPINDRKQLTTSITWFTTARGLRGLHDESHCSGIDFGNLEECDLNGCLRASNCETGV